MDLFARELHWYINYTHVSNQCLTRGRERGWGFTKLCRGLRCTEGYRAPHSDARSARARDIACSNIILSSYTNILFLNNDNFYK